MPSEAVSRIRARIGDMGLPGVVWVVYSTTGGDMAAFYDRDKANEYAAQAADRFVGDKPLPVRDAFVR